MLGSVQVLYKLLREGVGLTKNAYYTYVVEGRGVLEAKCLCIRSEFFCEISLEASVRTYVRKYQ